MWPRTGSRNLFVMGCVDRGDFNGLPSADFMGRGMGYRKDSRLRGHGVVMGGVLQGMCELEESVWKREGWEVVEKRASRQEQR